jgi:hypothetical protein
VVLHGQGLNVVHYARISWVRHAERVIYWGDIDAPGMQFVNDLRSHGIAADTAMMDMDTLTRYRHLAVDGAGPQRSRLPHLTDSEQALFTHLVDHATSTGSGLLLEQERIPWQHAYSILTQAIRTPGKR